MRALSICRGSVSRGSGFQALNAALGSGSVRFVVHQEDQPGDWEQTGRFLFRRARQHVQRLPAPSALPRTSHPHCSVQALRVLTPMSLERLSFSCGDDPDEQLTRRALTLMGLLSGAPAQPRLPQDSLPVTIDWSAHDLQRILAASAPSIGIGVRLTEQLQRLLRRGEHSRARGLIESSLLEQMEQPGLRLWLALAWLSDPSLPLAERVRQASPWISPQAVDGAAEPLGALAGAAQAIVGQPEAYRLAPRERRWLRGLAALPLASRRPSQHRV